MDRGAVGLRYNGTAVRVREGANICRGAHVSPVCHVLARVSQGLLPLGRRDYDLGRHYSGGYGRSREPLAAGLALLL